MNKGQRKIELFRDNSGIALISVIIVGLVCALIASIVLEITYTSLQSRKVYKEATKTTYEAEGTVDDMEAVIQDIAYYAVQKNSVDVSKSFITVASETLASASGANLNSPAQEDLDKVADYIYSNLTEEYKIMLGSKNDEGTLVRDSSLFSVTGIEKDTASDTGKLAISVSFTYEDNQGFQSRISTDLVLNDITTRKAASDYSLGSYSMFSGGGVKFIDGSGNQHQNYKSNYFKQNGNAYIGTMGSAAPKAMEIDYSTVDFAGATIINGDVYLNDQSVLMFTSNDKDEVTIYGTVYIDKGSVLIIGENIDFMCKDIVITDADGNQHSVFDGVDPVSYDGTSSYKSLFPFDKTDSSQLSTNSANQIISDFRDQKIGGCVMIKKNDKAYVAKFDTTKKKWTLLGNNAPTVSVLINHDETCVPEAKSTIWTYNDEEVQCDTEMCSFMNMQVFYWQYKSGNACLYSHTAAILDSTGDEVTKSSVNIEIGGATPDMLYGIGTKTTTELNGIYNSSKQFNGGKLNLSTIGLPNITLDGNTFTVMKLKLGNIQDVGENLELGDNSILLGCCWQPYTVQGTGNFCGIAMSCECTTYKVNDGKMEAYSILSIPDSEKTTRNELMSKLSYCCCLRFSSVGTTSGNGAAFSAYHDDLYKLAMLENLFVGGMKSFTSDSSSASGGSVSVNTSNMYDFITIENWQTN